MGELFPLYVQSWYFLYSRDAVSRVPTPGLLRRHFPVSLVSLIISVVDVSRLLNLTLIVHWWLPLPRSSIRAVLNRWSGEHGISVLNFLVCFDLLFAVSSFSSLSTICWITFPNFSVSDLNSVSDCFMLLSCPPFLRGPPPPLTLQLNHNDYSLRHRAAFLIYTSAFHFNGYDFKQVVQSQWFLCV